MGHVSGFPGRPAEVKALKAEADQAKAAGHYRKARRAFEALSELDPNEPLYPHRVGEIHARMGAPDAAALWYQRAVQLYLRQGQVERAIAVCKLILSDVPEHNWGKEALDRLYQEKWARTLRQTTPVPPQLATKAAAIGLRPSEPVGVAQLTERYHAAPAAAEQSEPQRSSRPTARLDFDFERRRSFLPEGFAPLPTSPSGADSAAAQLPQVRGITPPSAEHAGLDAAPPPEPSLPFAPTIAQNDYAFVFEHSASAAHAATVEIAELEPQQPRRAF